MSLAQRLKERREKLEKAGAATPIDRSKPEGVARKLGWLKNGKNKNVQKEYNQGANR